MDERLKKSVRKSEQVFGKPVTDSPPTSSHFQ